MSVVVGKVCPEIARTVRYGTDGKGNIVSGVLDSIDGARSHGGDHMMTVNVACNGSNGYTLLYGLTTG